jgi:hypothetical protein
MKKPYCFIKRVNFNFVNCRFHCTECPIYNATLTSAVFVSFGDMNIIGQTSFLRQNLQNGSSAKAKAIPLHATKALGWTGGISPTHSWPRQYRVSGQCHAPAALQPRGEGPRYPLYRRLSRSQSRYGHRGYRKILSPLQRIEPRSSGRPARIQTLYWLSYPSSNSFTADIENIHHLLEGKHASILACFVLLCEAFLCQYWQQSVRYCI